MSRSRKKVGRFGCCIGSNTTFYRARNRAMRRIIRSRIHTLLSKFGIEELSEKIMGIKKNELLKFNEWNSPTDGYCYVERCNIDDEDWKDWACKVYRK